MSRLTRKSRFSTSHLTKPAQQPKELSFASTVLRCAREIEDGYFGIEMQTGLLVYLETN